MNFNFIFNIQTQVTNPDINSRSAEQSNLLCKRRASEIVETAEKQKHKRIQLRDICFKRNIGLPFKAKREKLERLKDRRKEKKKILSWKRN